MIVAASSTYAEGKSAFRAKWLVPSEDCEAAAAFLNPWTSLLAPDELAEALVVTGQLAYTRFHSPLELFLVSC